MKLKNQEERMLWAASIAAFLERGEGWTLRACRVSYMEGHEFHKNPEAAERQEVRDAMGRAAAVIMRFRQVRRGKA